MAINFARRLFIYTYIHLEDAYGAYHALKDLYDEGKIRAIGISNFYVGRMIDFASFNRF